MNLFTAALCHTGMLHSIVVTSDNLAHSKDTIIAYLDMLLEMIPNSVKTVSIWSVGPASQFKIRFIAAAMILLQEKTQHEYSLEFLCHVSRQGVYRWDRWRCKTVHVVKQRKEIVVNRASSFVEVAGGIPQVGILEMTTSDIEKRNEALK